MGLCENGNVEVAFHSQPTLPTCSSLVPASPPRSSARCVFPGRPHAICSVHAL